MLKMIVFFYTILFVTACNSHRKINVEYAGALKTIMHNGDISSKINLNQFANAKNFFALGAVENLKGEIIIIDSEPIISEVIDSALNINKTFNAGASLLVYTQVEKWKEFSIPREITDLESFKSFLVNAAKNNNIDTGSPFPFLIEGKVKYAEWHVIDWVKGDNIHTREKHKNSGLKGTIPAAEVTLLGFYSDKHKGIFTHQSSDMHIHMVNREKSVAGHLDNFELEDAELFIPELN